MPRNATYKELFDQSSYLLAMDDILYIDGCKLVLWPALGLSAIGIHVHQRIAPVYYIYGFFFWLKTNRSASKGRRPTLQFIPLRVIQLRIARGPTPLVAS